eukprot:scaffold31189_cov58-Phaeocystis_antarctica.AAC.3
MAPRLTSSLALHAPGCAYTRAWVEPLNRSGPSVSPTWRGTASRQGQSALLVCPSSPLLHLLGDAPGGYERLGTPRGHGDTVSCAIFWLTAILFDPPGLGITSCDRITSTEVCHNETHDPDETGCVFDDVRTLSSHLTGDCLELNPGID